MNVGTWVRNALKFLYQNAINDTSKILKKINRPLKNFQKPLIMSSFGQKFDSSTKVADLDSDANVWYSPK